MSMNKRIFLLLLVLLQPALFTIADEAEETIMNTTSPVIIDRLMGPGYSKPRPEDAVVDVIMLHFSSAVVLHPERPYDAMEIIDLFKHYTVSSHYLIDRDGTIYRLVPESEQAFHAGKGEMPWGGKRKNVLNATSIGIELLAIGSKDDMRIFLTPEQYDQVPEEFIGYTDAQYEALNALLADIESRWPAIRHDRRHILGHEEYAPGRRTDPGELFDWRRIGLER